MDGRKCTYADTNRLMAGVCKLRLVGLVRGDASILDSVGGTMTYTPPSSGHGACLSIPQSSATLKQLYPQFHPSLHA